MFDLHAWLLALAVIMTMAVATWLTSLPVRDVSIVDSVWSLMLLAAAGAYVYEAQPPGPRGWLVLGLVAAWALRLTIYITWRNHGTGEDRRYQEIRRRNEPGFAFKSLYLVFALQGCLAWILSLSLLAAIFSPRPLGWLDAAGVALWLFGFLFEAIGDAQLSRFKADPRNKGQVMDRGLWRYTRHPNYFGEACTWWAFFLIALASGGWWSLVSPLMITFMLLRVSGVTLLEKDLTERRPAYQAYIRRTSAFLPRRPRPGARS